jgi:pimeloyl-ACP methyl ester carboxylesterase
MHGFFAAEEAALDSGGLDAATEVNVEFWLPNAAPEVRAVIREQQRRAFELQIDADDHESLLVEDLPSRLDAVDMPVLVITGEDDHGDFVAIADRLASSLPNARREHIPGAGHLPSLEQAAAFDAVVLPFVRSLS